jgi:hypothetical protein
VILTDQLMAIRNISGIITCRMFTNTPVIGIVRFIALALCLFLKTIALALCLMFVVVITLKIIQPSRILLSGLMKNRQSATIL